MVTFTNCSKSPPARVQPGSSELMFTFNGFVNGFVESAESIVREKVPGAVSVTVSMGDPEPWVSEMVTGGCGLLGALGDVN